MFTGIITDIGTVTPLEKKGGLCAEIRTGYDMRKIVIGASIAVNGVCLTVTAKTRNSFSVDISQETLSRTTLGGLKKGSRVNLEQSLKLGDELGGHIVSGHIDATATLIEKKRAGSSYIMGFAAPKKLMRLIAEKGSVALDGVSLTVNRVSSNSFWVNIIPHTLAATTFGALQKGDAVNLEIDTVARYLDRLKG